MSDIGKDGWPTADAVLRSERAEHERELAAVKAENEWLRRTLIDLRLRLHAAGRRSMTRSPPRTAKEAWEHSNHERG